MVLGTLHVAVIAPVFGVYSEREAILANDRLLAPRLRAAAAEVPQLQAQLAQLNQVASRRKIVLEGSSDAIASAGLQSRIDEIAGAAGVAIASIEGLSAETRGFYRRIGLRIAVRGSYEGMVRLLAAVEMANPPLVVDNLQIHGAPQLVGSSAPTQLHGGFEVYGFRDDRMPTVTKP